MPTHAQPQYDGIITQIFEIVHIFLKNKNCVNKGRIRPTHRRTDSRRVCALMCQHSAAAAAVGVVAAAAVATAIVVAVAVAAAAAKEKDKNDNP